MECERRRSLPVRAGIDPEAWNFAESLGEDVFREYWKTVLAHGGLRLDQQQLEFACQRFMEADRPESAIGILSGVTYDKVTVFTVVVMDALDACLRIVRHEAW